MDSFITIFFKQRKNIQHFFSTFRREAAKYFFSTFRCEAVNFISCLPIPFFQHFSLFFSTLGKDHYFSALFQHFCCRSPFFSTFTNTLKKHCSVSLQPREAAAHTIYAHKIPASFLRHSSGRSKAPSGGRRRLPTSSCSAGSSARD